MTDHGSAPGLVGWWAGLSPAAGAAVMATAIVSVGLHLTGHENLSLAALALGTLFWAALAADFLIRLVSDLARWEAEADTPPALTAVAATCVLGTRYALLGWTTLAVALLALACVLWLVLLPSVLRHWGRRMPGGVFLVCVATQGLAVLSGTLAPLLDVDWLARAALAAFCLGLVLYVAAFVRFDLTTVRSGAGDQWVAGGALAISALAGSKLVAAPQLTGSLHDVLRTAALVLLGLDLACYLLLLAAEIRWPRLRYDVRRWATVFPMGMTAVATLSVATAAKVPWLEGPGKVLLWIAVAVWAAVCTGMGRSAARAVTGRP
ncbi:tellurite resistance/C4-dicarboxylate transporter family protein [Streptomyces sp. TRM66268-LWL]|uniref:Tellurite resistance/C4-dicarboxylate transporter family protein n=1 Tax=Streptomyces polyasparticus TaxID=2767826 RepID=A0ABR7SFJ8_9ACTN|nr:tellurite resistance/C4-dicarboxylate transporter family protein [Streptomyces polyasparticus]MBC9713974.1 tellurite resistance/C4-dicarboxylate transporter family protein [Streptomyces polyasparticus]